MKTKQAQHTPGPWKQHGRLILSENGDMTGIVVQGAGYQVEANARLIAAAPELLEALRDGLRSLEWALGECGMERAEVTNAESVKRMRAVIAKAERGQ